MVMLDSGGVCVRYAATVYCFCSPTRLRIILVSIPIARRQKQVSFVAAPELVAVGQQGKGIRALTVSLLQECGLGIVR